MTTPKYTASREARIASIIVMYTLLTMVLGTGVGIWIKLFWLGWVFAR